MIYFDASSSYTDYINVNICLFKVDYLLHFNLKTNNLVKKKSYFGYLISTISASSVYHCIVPPLAKMMDFNPPVERKLSFKEWDAQCCKIVRISCFILNMLSWCFEIFRDLKFGGNVYIVSLTEGVLAFLYKKNKPAWDTYSSSH